MQGYPMRIAQLNEKRGGVGLVDSEAELWIRCRARVRLAGALVSHHRMGPYLNGECLCCDGMAQERLDVASR